MATIVGVRFKNAGKLYYFDPGELWPVPGNFVIVETARGMEYGQVITGVCEVSDDMITPPLKTILRIANERDARHSEENEKFEKEAYQICQRKIDEHKLDMKLVGVEQTFDNAKLLFYFTANGRVDFRSLVKDLASVFRTRIELRQIGVRDEAKMLGGLGPCGRPICCGSFLGDFQPVSIKMAKEQTLSLRPNQDHGVCGRLMCCRKFEEDHYEPPAKTAKNRQGVETPDGFGTVIDLNGSRKQCCTVRRETVEQNLSSGLRGSGRRYTLPPSRRRGSKGRSEQASAETRGFRFHPLEVITSDDSFDEDLPPEDDAAMDADQNDTAYENEPLTEEIDDEASPSTWQQAVADALRKAHDSNR